MEKLESAARQVWQEFSPRDGEDLAFGDNNIIEVTVGGGTEGFDMDPEMIRQWKASETTPNRMFL